MKILFVSNLYPPNAVGGYERLCYEVASAIAQKHSVSIATSTYGQSLSTHHGQRVHQVLRLLVGATIYEAFPGGGHAEDLINRSNVYFLEELIRLENPDVIYCWSLYGLDASVLASLVASGRSVVLMLTDNWFLPMWQKLDDSVRYSARLTAIFGSNFMRRYYIEGGVKFSRDAVIHNGVKLSGAAELEFRDRKRLAAPGKFRILFAGRVVRVKGVHTAVEALVRLRKDPQGNDLDYSLTVIGDSSDLTYIEELRSLARSGGVEGALHFVPPVSVEELFALFQGFDCLVFPSLYEPFALTLILALDAGIPTIATKTGGNTEIVRDGESGLLVGAEDSGAFAEKLKLLSAHSDLRGKISKGGRDAASEFSFDRMILQMESFLHEVSMNEAH